MCSVISGRVSSPIFNIRKRSLRSAKGITYPSIQISFIFSKKEFNPVSLSFLDGINGRVWLASDRHGAKLIGDDRHWRVNVAHVLKLGREKCPPTLWRPMAKTLLEKAPAYARKPRL